MEPTLPLVQHSSTHSINIPVYQYTWCVLIRILGIAVCIRWCVLNRTTSHPNRNTSLSRVSSISQEQGNSRSGPETFVASEIFSVSVQYFGLQYFLCTWAVLVDIYYNKVQCVHCS